MDVKSTALSQGSEKPKRRRKRNRGGEELKKKENTNKAPIQEANEEKKKKGRKRKRGGERSQIKEHTGKGAINDANQVDKRPKKKNAKPLNGLILALSTQDPKDKKEGRSDSSYKEVSALCEELGASVTPQVHKRVFAVICNKSAAVQSTQRVRKAMKRCLPIIDVDWLLKCKEEGTRVDHEQYSLTELAQQAEAGKKKKNEVASNETHVEYDEELLKSDLWTEAIDVGCCCVCHDDDRDDCPWCICPVNQMKRKKNSNSK